MEKITYFLIDNKLIKQIEKQFRTSLEYNMWLSQCRSKEGGDRCAVCQETKEDKEDILYSEYTRLSLEMHHIITLYDIVNFVCLKMSQDKPEGFTTFDVCNELARLHLDDEIPYVPLCKTHHEKLHNKLIAPIQKNQIRGNYTKFFNEYKNYIDLETKYKILVTFDINLEK